MAGLQNGLQPSPQLSVPGGGRIASGRNISHPSTAARTPGTSALSISFTSSVKLVLAVTAPCRRSLVTRVIAEAVDGHGTAVEEEVGYLAAMPSTWYLGLVRAQDYLTIGL